MRYDKMNVLLRMTTPAQSLATPQMPVSIFEVAIEVAVVFTFIFSFVLIRPWYQARKAQQAAQLLKQKNLCKGEASSEEQSDVETAGDAGPDAKQNQPEEQIPRDEYTKELIEAAIKKLAMLTPEVIEDQFCRKLSYYSSDDEDGEGPATSATATPEDPADWDAVGDRISDIFACFAEDSD